MNMRINDRGEAIVEGDQVFIGGNESYVSTCRLHFKRGESKNGVTPEPLLNKDTNLI